MSLHDEVRRQDLYGIKFELARGDDPNAVDETGRTALHWAALECHSSVIRLLIKRGADVNAPDLRGETPLHYAARAANLEAARLLLKAGADTQLQSRQGVRPTEVGTKSWRKRLFQAIFADFHATVGSG